MPVCPQAHPPLNLQDTDAVSELVRKVASGGLYYVRQIMKRWRTLLSEAALYVSPVARKENDMKWLSRFIVFAVASGSGVGAQDAPSQVRADLAPTGKLRVALLPLPHIAVRDKDTGDFRGVVVDL